MAMGTGVGNISLVDRRSGIARLLQIMSAVTITAGGRLLIAGCELDPMDAFLITRDESGRVSDRFQNLRVIQVTLQAEPRFFYFGYRRSRFLHGNDCVRPVAADTGRRSILLVKREFRREP